MFESFYEKRLRFEISSKDYTVRISFENKVDKAGRYSDSNLPLWFQNLSKTQIPRILHKRRSLQKNDILALVHMTPGAGTDETAPCVLQLSELDPYRIKSDF